MCYLEVFKHVFKISLNSSVRKVSYVSCEWRLFRYWFASVGAAAAVLTTTTTTTATSVPPSSLITVPKNRI